MIGTLINVASVTLGASLGLLLRARLPKRLTTIVFQGIGLFTLFLGFDMASKTANPLIMILSIVIGSILGESLDIEKALERFSEFVKKKVKSKESKFSEGFVTAFLLFCVGSLTILGAIEEGTGNKPNLLIAKSVLDGFSSIALAAALGVGVLFSVIPLFLYQGGLTIFASYLAPYMNDALINEMTAVGGLLLIGLGINILEIKQLKVINMLPSLLIAVIFAYFWPQ